MLRTMTATVIACACGKRYDLPRRIRGRKFRCARCKAVLLVPEARPAAAGKASRARACGAVAAAIVVVSAVAAWAMTRRAGAPPFDPSACWSSLWAPARPPTSYAEAVAFLPEVERSSPAKERLQELADQIRLREANYATVTARVAKVLTSTGRPEEIAEQLALDGAFLLGLAASGTPWRQLYLPRAEEDGNRLLAMAVEKDPANVKAHAALGRRKFEISRKLLDLKSGIGRGRIPEELLEADGTFVPAARHAELVAQDGGTVAAIEQFGRERERNYRERVANVEAAVRAQAGFKDREWYSTGVEFEPVLMFAEKKAGFDCERIAREKAAMIRVLHEQFVERYVQPWGLMPEGDATFPLVAVVVPKPEDYASLMQALGTPAPGAQVANYDLVTKKVILHAGDRPGSDKLTVMMNHMFVFHEATHQMVDAYDGNSTHTYFFYEGFAEFNGSCDKDGDRWTFQQPSLYRLRQLGNMFNIRNVWPQAPAGELLFTLKELWDIPYAGAMANAVVGKVASARWGPGSVGMAQTGYYGQASSVHYFLEVGQDGRYREGYRKYLEWEMTGKVDEKLKAGQTGSQIVLAAPGLQAADLGRLEAEWRTFAKELVADPGSHPNAAK